MSFTSADVSVNNKKTKVKKDEESSSDDDSESEEEPKPKKVEPPKGSSQILYLFDINLDHKLSY